MHLSYRSFQRAVVPTALGQHPSRLDVATRCEMIAAKVSSWTPVLTASGVASSRKQPFGLNGCLTDDEAFKFRLARNLGLML